MAARTGRPKATAAARGWFSRSDGYAPVNKALVQAGISFMSVPPLSVPPYGGSYAQRETEARKLERGQDVPV